MKTPVWPLHTWMPLTYADTPPPMVAVVSAVQSKAGLYGFIAIALAFMPDYVQQYAALLLIVLGAISLLYGAFIALVQTRCQAHRRVLVALAPRADRHRDCLVQSDSRCKARWSTSSRTGSSRRRSS